MHKVITISQTCISTSLFDECNIIIELDEGLVRSPFIWVINSCQTSNPRIKFFFSGANFKEQAFISLAYCLSLGFNLLAEVLTDCLDESEKIRGALKNI